MLAKEIRKRSPGDEVTIQVERDGKEENVDVELGEYSEVDMWQEFEGKFPELFQVKPGEMPNVFRRTPDAKTPGIFTYVYGERKYIGVELQALNPELADFFGVEDGSGLLIAKVTEDGPAEKAGLKVGDVIVQANEKPMPSPDKLQRLIQSLKTGDKIKLEVIRNKKKMKIEVEVGEDESRGRRFFPEAWSEAKAFETYKDAFQQNNQQLKQQFQTYSNAWKEYDNNLKSRYKEWVDKYQQQNYEKQKKYQDAVKKYSETKNLRHIFARYRCIKV